MTAALCALVIQDADGEVVRFWPVYRLFVAWSQRDGTMRIFGAFCMN